MSFEGYNSASHGAFGTEICKGEIKDWITVPLGPDLFWRLLFKKKC